MKPLKKALKAFEDDYQAMKAMLLRAGADGRLPVRQMASRLDEISSIRRIVDQAFKAAKHSNKLRKNLYRYKGGWSAENSENDDQQGENGVRLAHGIESKAPLADAGGSASAVQAGAPDLGEQKRGDVTPLMTRRTGRKVVGQQAPKLSEWRRIFDLKPFACQWVGKAQVFGM